MRSSKPSNNSATATIEHLLVMAFAILTIGCGEKKSDGVNAHESDGVNAHESNIKEVEIDTVITKTIGVNYNKLEEIDGIFHLKGSHLPYTGKSFDLHKNGEKQEIRIYKDGKEEGLQKFWYDNGNKMSEVNVKRNEQHGLSTFWYKSGNKKSETNWRDGKTDGLMSSWHENGQKMENATYKKGKPDGRSLTWHENGQTKSETNWKNGQMDGTLTLWHKNGKKMLQGAVKGGKPNSIQFWNSKGEEVDSQEEAGLNGPLFEALGGVGFAYYTMKMNEDSYKAIAIPVKGLQTELCEGWEAAFQEVLSNKAILQKIADETQYAEKLGVPPEEAVSHLKEAIKVRFVKRNNWIEIGLVGKRKQNEDLTKIAKLLHERGVENVVKKAPSFQQYLDELSKQKAKGKKDKSE
jgi:antitoxin component YwqK of YwqJK toxin-antitoxin module